MVRNVSATEVMDLFCDNFSGSESEMEGVQEIYGYRGHTTIETK